jgi:hypothetical protein
MPVLGMGCRWKLAPGFGTDRSRNGLRRCWQTLTDERFSRQGWLFEPKWDGESCLAFRRGGSLRVLSRNRILLNDKYPEITAALDRHRGRRLLSKRRVARAGRG